MKKITTIILSLVLTFSILPTNIFAGNGPSKSGYAYISVGSDDSGWKSVYSEYKQTDSVTGVTYNESTNTLTISNYSGLNNTISVNEMGDDFKLNIIGTNSLKSLVVYGFNYGGSLEITGTGTLLINENKTAIPQNRSPITLFAEESASQLKINSSVKLKIYSGSNTIPSIFIDSTTIADNGIILMGNTDLNSNVTHKKFNAPDTCGASTINESEFTPCVPKDNTDTNNYVADYDFTTGSYSIYKFISNSIGTFAGEATDQLGNPLNPSDFTIDTENEDSITAYKLTPYSMDFTMYTDSQNSNSTYAVGYYESYVNNESQGFFYDVYTLIDIPELGGLVAIPVNNMQKLSSLPDSFSYIMKPYELNNYNYNQSELILNIKDSCSEGHNTTTTVVKATPSTNGKIMNVCSVCGKTISTSDIYSPKTVSLSDSTYTYSGSVKKPNVTVLGSDKKVISSDNYTLSYSSGLKNVGRYAVTVKFKGNYSGAITKTFDINPKRTSIASLSSGSKRFKVKWKKQAKQITGYQIKYSTNKNFKSAKNITIGKASASSKTISKLLAKKKYYVKIRCYKKAKYSGKSIKLYSKWSSTKKVTTKK